MFVNELQTVYNPPSKDISTPAIALEIVCTHEKKMIC
jgi:hypothetical protein